MSYQAQQTQLTPPVAAGDHIQGPDSAPITLVEFGDFQCPYCGDAFRIVKRLQEEFGDKLRFVFRDFPLTDVHPHAEPAAEAPAATEAEPEEKK